MVFYSPPGSFTVCTCCYGARGRFNITRSWATAFPWTSQYSSTFTAPMRALVAHVINEHRGLVLLPAAGKAFCRLVARGVLFSHCILRNVLSVTSGTRCLVTALYRYTTLQATDRQGSPPLQQKQNRNTGKHREARREIWRSGTHGPTTSLKKQLKKPSYKLVKRKKYGKRPVCPDL